MRLEVTRRTDLATRALLLLAAAGERRSATQLASALDTSPGFLTQAMTPLVRRGWVDAEQGRAGGYRTVVPVHELSVLDVVEALEGPTDVITCVVEDRPCAGGDHCALHRAWAHARSQLLANLAATPLDRTTSPRRSR